MPNENTGIDDNNQTLFKSLMMPPNTNTTPSLGKTVMIPAVSRKYSKRVLESTCTSLMINKERDGAGDDFSVNKLIIQPDLKQDHSFI